MCLQSTYESRLATILDELNIKWIRPTFLRYNIDGKSKRYWPDFLLVDVNIYLDPKK